MFKRIIKHNRTRVITRSSVLPEFLNIYIKSYCHTNGSTINEYINSIDNIKNCLNEAIIPDLNIQSLMLENLHKIAMKTDISNFEAPLMRLMLEDDKAKFNDLVEAIQDYNLSIDHIKLILENIGVNEAANNKNI
jgi:hypothetical protein